MKKLIFLIIFLIGGLLCGPNVIADNLSINGSISSVTLNGMQIYPVSPAPIPDPNPPPVPPPQPPPSGSLPVNQWTELPFAAGTTTSYSVYIPQCGAINLQILGQAKQETDLDYSFTLPPGSLTPTYFGSPVTLSGDVIGTDIGGQVRLYNNSYPDWQGYIYPAKSLPAGYYTLTIKAISNSFVRIGLFYR